MGNDALLELLRDFIRESKEAAIVNAKEHKEVSACLSGVKLQINSVESICKNSDNIRKACFKTQDDIEARLRKVEL